MKRYLSAALTCALLLPGAAGAAGPMTPMHPGFHQLLKCNGGYVTIDVAPANPHVAADAMVVTTAIASGPSLNKTQAVRELDHRGAIFAIGYLTGSAFKRFPRRLLLPADPPRPGERSEYFNISGTVIEKRFDGAAPTRDAEGKPASGWAFSDYLSGHKLNTIIYLPPVGITEARFYGLSGAKDTVCRLAG